MNARQLSGGLSRRGLLAGMIGAAGTLTVAACGQSSSGTVGKQGGSIAIAGSAGVYQETANSVKSAVETATGINYTYSALGSTNDYIAKLQAAHGQSPPFDAGITGSDLAWLGHHQGLLERIPTGGVPNLSHVEPEFRKIVTDGSNLIAVPLGYKVQGILWRKDLVPFEIKSWHDLWRPELKKRITVQSMPQLGGRMVLLMAAIINGGSQKNIEPGWKALAKLKPNIQSFFAVTSDALNGLVAGDSWVSVNTLDLGLPLKSKNVVATAPSEGLIWSMDALSIAKGTEHADWAAKMINGFTSESLNDEWIEGVETGSVTSYPLPPKVKANTVETPALSKRLFPIDLLQIGLDSAEWTQRWQHEIAS